MFREKKMFSSLQYINVDDTAYMMEEQNKVDKNVSAGTTVMYLL